MKDGQCQAPLRTKEGSSQNHKNPKPEIERWVYNAHSPALVVFSHSLARAVAADGVRVNVVNPGHVRT